jgi:O-acetyl-ADP-ribose deacetylase (regulator of RNase III)
MFDLVEATGNKEAISKASRYLDHEMRLRYIYSNAGLNENAIKKHLQNLRQQRERIENTRSHEHHEPDIILKAQHTHNGLEIRVMYGDITSRALMSDPEFQEKRRAVISPEDTCISAGGGVAYGLLLKAGQKALLNELAKFSPIPQNEVAVTSAGNLPVHYIIHAATLKIESDATYSVDRHNVQMTMDAVLNKLDSLGIEVVWTPLIASGAASLKAIDSFDAILNSLCDYANLNKNSGRAVTIIIVIYQEKDLSRQSVFESFRDILGGNFNMIQL